MDDTQLGDHDSCPEPGLDFFKRFSHLRDLTTLQDFTIVCGARQWKVHRVVLALHSKVLERACVGEFKEAKEGILKLSHLDEDVVDALVQYLYTFKYETDLLNLHVRIAIAADQYDIQALKKVSSDKIQRLLRYYTICTSQIIEDFPRAARLAYDARPAVKGICVTIVQSCVHVMNTRIAAKDLLRSVEAAMTDIPALGLDVARAYAAVLKCNEIKDGLDAFECFSCDNFFATEPVSDDDFYWCPNCCTKMQRGVDVMIEKGASVRDIVDRSDWWKE